MDDSRRSCGDYRHTWVTELGKASFVGDLDSPQQALHGLLAPALSAAINNGQVSTGAYLLDRGAVMAQELFLKATLSKSYPILELFLVRGWDINTPVDLFRPPALAYTYQDPALTEWFLEHGEDPNARCSRDCTPLSWVARDAPFPCIQRLFSRGGSSDSGQLLHHPARHTLPDRVKQVRDCSRGLEYADVLAVGLMESVTPGITGEIGSG